MIDDLDRELYLHAREGNSDETFWVMPGGGLLPGETFEQAAIRESGRLSIPRPAPLNGDVR
jgi:ADP-ribose pyrophosphatase YjhB (NUDIX family)